MSDLDPIEEINRSLGKLDENGQLPRWVIWTGTVKDWEKFKKRCNPSFPGFTRKEKAALQRELDETGMLYLTVPHDPKMPIFKAPKSIRKKRKSNARK